MRHATLAAALLLSGCSSGGPIEPGMWETTTRLKAGQSELWTSKMKRCITEPETDDPVVGILSATPLSQCQSVESDYDGGAVSVFAHCMGRPGSMMGGMPQSRVRLNGRYGATTIDGQFTAELVHEQPSSDLSGTLTARRTGDCPA